MPMESKGDIEDLLSNTDDLMSSNKRSKIKALYDENDNENKIKSVIKNF
jgi:hypothetical protein